MAKRVPCMACAELLGPSKAKCPECRGVGYTEISECPAGKDFLSVCRDHLEYEAMVGGWMCHKCGESGPL